MRKLLKDAKSLLLENMVKLNPDFKLTEADEKWIQKAVDPEHKGFCTPMTKPTCTPRRKALAKRFKNGIDEEFSDVDVGDYNIKVERLKALMDELLKNQEYDVLDTLYRLMVERKKQVPAIPMAEASGGIMPYFKDDIDEFFHQNWMRGGIMPYFKDDIDAYNKKVESIKAKLDFLASNMDYEIIDKINIILQKIPTKTSETKLAEVQTQQNDTYFETLSAALDAVRERIEKKGFTVDEDAVFTQFGIGGINYGETKRANIPLLRNGIPDKRRSVTIAIYRMDSGKYELTAYLN